MFPIGAILIVFWPGTELHGCTGRLVAQEQKLTALKDVTCPNGSKFYEAVGIEDKRLIEVDTE